MADFGISARRRGHMSAQQRRLAQQRFLDAFAKTGVILRGCEAAGIHRTLIDYWLEHDEPFMQSYHQARREADDAIRAEILRRAIEGVVRRKMIRRRGDQGRLVTDRIETVTEFSDALLMFLARSRLPNEFGKPTIELVGDDAALRMLLDVVANNVDQATLDRIREAFAALAAQP